MPRRIIRLGEGGTFPSPPGSGPAVPGNLVLLNDRQFHAQMETPWYHDSGTLAAVEYISSAPEDPDGDAQACDWVYPAGYSGGLAPEKSEFDFGTKTELWIEETYRLSSNWVGHITNTNKRLHIWTLGSNRIYTDSWGSGSGTLQARVALQNVRTGQTDLDSNGDGEFNLPPNQNLTESSAIVRGQVHRTITYLKMNSGAGVRDGVVKVWHDGVLKQHYTNVDFYGTGVTGSGFTAIAIHPHWGGSGGTLTDEQRLRFYRLKIYGA